MADGKIYKYNGDGRFAVAESLDKGDSGGGMNEGEVGVRGLPDDPRVLREIIAAMGREIDDATRLINEVDRIVGQSPGRAEADADNE